MDAVIIAMGLLMAIALGYLIAGPIDIWLKSRVKAADLLTAEWNPKHDLWDTTVITWLRRQWLECEILTNVPVDSLITGPQGSQLRTLFSRRPVDLVVVNADRKIEMIYLLVIKNDLDRKRASQLRTILNQAGYRVALIDKEKLKEIEIDSDA